VTLVIKTFINISPLLRGDDMEEKINYSFLRKIGLTESEIKVYLALLKLGVSSKGAIIKESKIAPSKIYEIADKLIDKGLCSTITKNGVKHFMGASPARIRDYLHKKQEEILQEEKELEKIIPKLQSYYNKIPEGIKIEMFIGWKGIETVYLDLLDLSNRNEYVYIIGAGTGKNEKKLELFYTRHGRTAFKKGLKVKVIFNESARRYVSNIEKNIKKTYEKKFLFEHTPTEVLIFKDRTALIIRREEPLAVLIQDNETSNSFRRYFEELWKIAKK